MSSWLSDHLGGHPGTAIDAAVRDGLLARSVSLLTTTSLPELHGRFDPGGPDDPSARAFDPVWARAVAAKLASVDIVNISAGSVYPYAAIGPEAGALCRAEFLRQHRDARRALPGTARAIVQADIADAEKTGDVWGAGNLRTVLGDGARIETMELVSSFGGAFSFEAGSSVLAVEADGRVALDDGGRWSLAGSATLALDLPRGVGREPYPSPRLRNRALSASHRPRPSQAVRAESQGGTPFAPSAGGSSRRLRHAHRPHAERPDGDEERHRRQRHVQRAVALHGLRLGHRGLHGHGGRGRTGRDAEHRLPALPAGGQRSCGLGMR